MSEAANPAVGSPVRASVRATSTPERLGLLGVGVAGAAVVWPTVTGATGFGMPCPLRTVTGIPCPMCGMTTASIAMVRGQFGDAVSANPLIVVLAATTVVMLVVLGLRLAGGIAPARRWSADGQRRALRVGAVLAALSWAWQIHRVGPIDV